jgi:hypothetical protein
VLRTRGRTLPGAFSSSARSPQDAQGCSREDFEAMLRNPSGVPRVSTIIFRATYIAIYRGTYEKGKIGNASVC